MDGSITKIRIYNKNSSAIYNSIHRAHYTFAIMVIREQYIGLTCFNAVIAVPFCNIYNQAIISPILIIGSPKEAALY